MTQETNTEASLLERPAGQNPVSKAPNGIPQTVRKVKAQARQIGLSLLRGWWIIILLTVAGGVIGYIQDKVNYEPTRYTATYLFNLETQSAPPGLDFANFFGGSSSVDAGLFAGENFFILFSSRPLVERSLLKIVDINGKKVFLVNYFLEKSGMRETDWKEDEKMQKFLFDPKKPRTSYTREEVSTLNAIRGKIQGMVLIGQPSKKSSFLNVTVTTRDEILSLVLARTMLETVSEFYTSSKTRKTLEILNLARKRRDSLRVALFSNEYQQARYADQNQGIIVAEGQLAQKRIGRNTELAGGMYTEALRNVETIQASLVRETPLITFIDYPVLPLPMEIWKARGQKTGTILGFLLGIAFILLRRTYLHLMQE